MLKIRKAVPDDAGALARLSRDGMGYEYDTEKTKENLKTALGKDYECVLVAELDGNTVGYIHACDYCLLFSEKFVNVLGISVDPTLTRQGIGRALMTAVEEWARTRKAVGVRLVSGEARIGAHAFYEKCGYKSNKTQKNFKKIF
ncbi:MAG: N-acetyltransferase [Clostridia bacterium]|nr:N-acetyltransferase [Clostridia bacterium]